ncbi:MAG: hypothetical protein ACRDFB_10610 [Rhabdochlamydiaceae bacterium]
MKTVFFAIITILVLVISITNNVYAQSSSAGSTSLAKVSVGLFNMTETSPTIVISGIIYKAFSQNMVLTIFNPQNQLISVSQLQPRLDGTFSQNIIPSNPLWPKGNYTMRVTSGSQNLTESIFYFPGIGCCKRIITPGVQGHLDNSTTLSPLKQFKSGILASGVHCGQGLELVLKVEDGSPACIKPDSAYILIYRGWAKEIVPSIPITKVSPTKNQVISIGNDTYDTIEFQTMTSNTVSLDNVKFTYHGASPLNNNCYPDLTNQTEARDFEMIPGNISDMNTHQCWPPSNYPLKITNESTMPQDLFSKYAINFFDYNQTIGVGWCHSDSCYLGQTLYLVKRSWDAPVIYDDPVSLLEFHLGTNASVISSDQAIAIDMSTSNKLPKTILVPSEYNYSFKGTGLGPCTYGPFDLAILEGFYGENNFTQGNKLSLYPPGIYSCPVSITPQGYKFEPMSNNVVDRCEPFDGCSNTGQIQFRNSFSGSWNDTSFHKFESGVYTIIAGDEWGHFAIQHFVVNNSNGNQ